MHEITHVAHPPDRPLLIFDGDCDFCRLWIERWRRITQDRVEYLALQAPRVAEQFPEIDREQLEQAVHFVDVDGGVCRGAEAAFRALARTRQWPLRAYERLPGARPLCDVSYRVIAANRSFFSFLTRLFWGRQIGPPQQVLVRWLFLRGLGIIYLIAFLSLWSQVLGLSGSDGIVPAPLVMQSVRENVGTDGLDRLRIVPTLCWLRADDAFLEAQCVAGVVLSVALVAGLAPSLCLMLLWLLYLSMVTIGTVFYGFQWDNLLLETGLLAIFFAPGRLWPNLARETPPSRWAVWLLRWLLFRLMFASGCVKLLSGDPTWHDLTALNFHYETQPLPTPLGWYAHQLPEWFQRGSVVVMYFIELVVPFFIFLPRRPRIAACGLFMLLQISILLTGNYTFFNWLTILLCLPLLDDAALGGVMPIRLQSAALAAAERPRRPWTRWLMRGRAGVCGAFAVIVLAVTSLQLRAMFGTEFKESSTAVKLYRWCAPWRSINSYGLFAVMTTSRPEIIVEGSNDGRNWEPYEFKDKPGILTRRPPWVAPHQPRLDWQMWFAALGDVRGNPWFVRFCRRLLEGSEDVLNLMETNPFPGQPPRMIRAVVYEYHFTDGESRRADGAWWRREYKGIYLPTQGLRPAGQGQGP